MNASGSGCIDLHIHSTASDGSLSPSEIVETAEEIGLSAISITDHDTLEGSAEAFACHPSSPVEILSGMELSAHFRSGTMHILGYLMRFDDPSLKHSLQAIQEGRAERNVKLVKKLKRLGVDIEYDEVLEAGGGGQIGRPHVAQVLVRKGVVRSFQEAFTRFLKKGGAAYVSRFRLSPAEAIGAILQAGGVPVLAHPFTLDANSEADLEAILLDLKQAGLRGVEVYSPGLGFLRAALYERLASRHGLLMTGGTDFHGAAKPNVHLGVGEGDLRIPYRLVEELKQEKA